MTYQPPRLTAPSEIAEAFDSICSAANALELLERSISTGGLNELPFLATDVWRTFLTQVRELFAERDHVVIERLPVTAHGATLLLASLTLALKFRTYRNGQIIKHFKMSPWTTDLSHTTREGEFHTDLNTELHPPAITAMQCLEPDPGPPGYGLSRVARSNDLLAFLRRADAHDALRFLIDDRVTMLNDRSASSWSGSIIEAGTLRYHPETLRAAARRSGYPAEPLEENIATVARAALAVSAPFALDRGDVLLLSNHRTLHYRGECSVVFKSYPLDFASRSIFILHANEELKRA